jgi:hypothetical protein
VTAVKILWGPAAIGGVTTTTTAFGGQALNDADNSAGWAFSLPKDGTVTDVGFFVTAENGTSPAYNCGIVALDSSGNPTTTPYGGSAITTHTATGTGWRWVTLSTGATANAGDIAAVRVYPTGTAPDGSNNISVSRTSITDDVGTNYAYTAGWINAAGTPPMAIKYSGGEIYGMALASATHHVQIRSNTTPDEVGCLFQVPAAMTCTGARFWAHDAGWGASATVDITLYSAADSVLATATVSDKDFVGNNNAVNVFWDAVNLSAATNYRLIIKPTVAAGGDIYTPKWTFESTAARSAVPEGARWQYTSRADAGAWTDDNVSVCPMGLWVSDITFSAGATAYEYGYIG